MHVIFALIIGQVPRGRHAPFVRLVDQNTGFTGCRLFYFDADDPLLRPLIDFRTDFLFGDVIRPGRAIVRGRLYAVFTSETAKIGSRDKKPGASGHSGIHKIAPLENSLRIIFTGRPGRCHSVRQEYDSVVDNFFGATLIDEVKIVVGVQINHSRKNCRRFVQVNHRSSRQCAYR